MGTRRNPRHGTMQFWPRKRSDKPYASVNSWAVAKDVTPLAFAGYKVGMTHIMLDDKRPNSMTKGEKISWPVTILECPPLTVHSARFYKNTPYGRKVITEVLNSKPKKHVARKVVIPKSVKQNFDNLPNFDDVTMLVHTNPDLTGIGKKKPDIFEVAIGGTKDEKLNYLKQNLGKDFAIQDVFKEGALIDVHAISKGHGYCGVVKKYGVAIRSHKSEKTKRGCIQGPQGYDKVLTTVPKSGKIGYHMRTNYNQVILKIDSDATKVNPVDGFGHYGIVKNQYILVKGSVIGVKKRLAILCRAIRPNQKKTIGASTVSWISTQSKQGR
ncbi:MAG: 50S ribosomal protein L3 [Candidatus Woesearchaeota archaeon]